MKNIFIAMILLVVMGSRGVVSQTLICDNTTTNQQIKVEGGQLYMLRVIRISNTSERAAMEVARSLQNSICREDTDATVSMSVFPEIDGYLVLGMVPRQ